MKVSQLRDLTRKYASGGLEREAYLKERLRLIDAITAGEEQPRYREIDAQPADQTRMSRRPANRTRLAASALLLVLVIAFLAHFLAGMASDPVERPARQNTVTNPAISLLLTFNAQDDWSESTLRKLETEWQATAPSARETARSSVAYRRLKREVDARIREQEALITTGDEPDALMQAARLRMFAERLEMTR
jgi:hypothetical protein